KLEDSQQETMPEETSPSTPETEAVQEATESSTTETQTQQETTNSTTEATSKETMPEAKATAEQNWSATWDPYHQSYHLEQYLGTDPAIVVPNEYNGKPTEIRCDNGISCQKISKHDVTSITFSNENGKKVKLEPTTQYTDFTMRDHYLLRYFDGSGLDISRAHKLHMAFYEDRQLTTIKGLENWDTSNIETMYAMFVGCSSLKSLDVSRFNTENVENLSEMFNGCSSLKSLDVSRFNTKKVKLTSMMFEGCSSLESLDVSNFDLSSVKHTYNMFKNCSSLKSLDVSNFDLSSVSFGYDMFKNCINLQFFDARNWNIPSTVVDISNMFSIDNGEAPLVILGNDDRLIQGTTKNRYPGGPKFVAGNNGYFGTVETKEKYYFNMLEKDPKKLEVASFEAFKTKLIPEVVDSTTKFLRWDGDKITTSEELVKEHVYQAKYLFDITAPGDGDQNVLPSSEYGISYVPKAFSVQGKLSNETDVQSIAIPGNFHVAVRDRRNQLGEWTLSAQLQWTGTPLTAEIQTTGGAVKKNSTNGQMNQESNLTDCPTSEVTGYSNVVIGSIPKPIMSANGSVTHDAIYDYSLGGVSLRINQPKDVAAGKYDGKIVWNLGNTLN
ncbi:hypothetical protein CYR81_04050, partial [Enterococcus faecalis]|uniref:BspA family leucine-rich repeat surface protein n=1 Tax=Enterococcus faecalis TaxID=1351 RepID=UPI000CBB55CE